MLYFDLLGLSNYLLDSTWDAGNVTDGTFFIDVKLVIPKGIAGKFIL
jgi:hypothetical protein